MGLSFEWDGAKARSNAEKHGVTFTEASSVFTIPWPSSSATRPIRTKEPREIMVGHSAEGRLLVVSFTERGQAIRIISARQATQRERKDHERHPLR
jgi:uncharacterized DUF497 family protein